MPMQSPARRHLLAGLLAAAPSLAATPALADDGTLFEHWSAECDRLEAEARVAIAAADPEDEDEAAEVFWRERDHFEDLLLTTPCRSRRAAVAKLKRAAISLTTGRRYDFVDVEALDQVAAWIEATR